MSRIRIAQIGVGHMHAEKIETIRRLSDVFDVVGVVAEDDRSRSRVESGARYDGVTWLSEEDVLADATIEAVLVETIETESVETALRCVRAGKHIHLDKPGGATYEPFAQLLAEAEQRDLTVQLGYMYRNNPAIQFCFDAVSSGLLGEVFEIDAVMSRLDGPELRRFYGNFEAGAGYIYMCHLLDLAVIIMGRPARTSSFMGRTRSDGLVDNMLTVLEGGNGCIASLRTSVVEVGAFPRRHLVVAGEHGTIVVQPLESGLNMSGGEAWLTLDAPREGWQAGRQRVPTSERAGRYDDQLIEFARIVRGEIPNPYPYAHELLVHETFIAACRATAAT